MESLTEFVEEMEKISDSYYRCKDEQVIAVITGALSQFARLQNAELKEIRELIGGGE